MPAAGKENECVLPGGVFGNKPFEGIDEDGKCMHVFSQSWILRFRISTNAPHERAIGFAGRGFVVALTAGDHGHRGQKE